MVQPLQRSTPEAQGIASGAILDFVAAADANLDSLHSFMLLRHGAVVAEGWWKPYAPHEPHMMYSLSKSFTSTAIGLLVDEGGVALDERVVSFFPDDLPADISDNLAAMEVRHLLSMSTGHHEDTLRATVSDSDGNWARAFLAQPVDHTPGTHFVYNSGATYMLSVIVQQRTGLTLLDYLHPRLFMPLGIEHPTWESCPRGINTGGWGLNIKTEDIARFGQMLLQKGMWQGDQIVPAAWVEEATARHIDNGDDPKNDWNQGYGYQFWRAQHNAYRGDGAFGQFCVVLPDQDAVVAITSGLGNMQEPLDLIWKHLLPAMGDAALPADDAAHAALEARLGSLGITPPEGATTSPMAAAVNGTRYALAPNDGDYKAIAFEFGDEGTVVRLETARGEYSVKAGWHGWERDEVYNAPEIYDGLTNRTQRIVAAGAWTADDTYHMRWCMYQTPYIYSMTCVFADDHVTMHNGVNVSFGPTEFEPVEGHAEKVATT